MDPGFSILERLQPSVKTKFCVLIAAVLAVVSGMLLLGKVGLDTLSGVRSYVGGEGLWSKGQKEASYRLARYANTGDESEYQAYLDAVAIPLGIRPARLELEKADPDIDVIRRGFTQAGIHRDDVKLMAWLVARFRRVEHIERALDIWAAGDELIAELDSLGSAIHASVVSGSAAAVELRSMANAIDPIHMRLDRLEKDFSHTLGTAARWAKGLLLQAMLVFSLVGGLFCLAGLLLVTRITSNLRGYSLDLAEQNRLKSGQTALNELLQGEPSLQELLDNALSFVAEYVDAQVGAVYLATEPTLLRLFSRHAFTNREGGASEIRFGEGVLGQAALDRKTVLLNDVPEDSLVISSALGTTLPKSVFVMPLVFERRVKAVVELGATHEFAEEDVRFLESVADSIAISINAVQSRERVQELLEQSQQQSEELEAQQEELRQTNEELEEQAAALRESEERLRNQQTELEEANATLEERTQDLEAERLRVERNNLELEAARREVEEKAEALEVTSKYKSEFLANMSHELRTPLNSILLLSNLLRKNKDGNLTEKQVDFARTIGGSGQDLLGLINEVLDLSKVESGKMELDVEDVDLESFLNVTERSFAELAVDKGIDFTIDLADGLPVHISTDEQRLGQIVKNLLSNAFKFTEQGSVTLSVSRPDPSDTIFAGKQLPDGQSVSICVSDTGIGIPDDMQSLIFEAFQQVEGSTNRKFGGTGLGLSISRELVRLLGGQLFVESVPGNGSRFAVVLPLEAPQHDCSEPTALAVVEHAGAEDSQESDAERQPSEVGDLENQTSAAVVDDRGKLKHGDRCILIIEDDREFAGVLLDLAHERSFKGVIAEDGRAGITLAEQYEPTAVLLDIGLPDIDGMSVMERLKENLKTRHIPVHVISGGQRKYEALKKGAVGFLQKPVSIDQLDYAFKKIESVVSSPVRRLLLAVGDEHDREHITELISETDVAITTVSNAKDALAKLGTQHVDCAVLDAELPDIQGVELLRRIRTGTDFSEVPVVVFGREDLSKSDRLTLDRYADRVVIKDAGYSERLLDETALFLHRVETNLPEDKRAMIRTLHDREAIFRDKKVLITDDDMRNVFALCSILEERNITTIVARDGREALARLEESPDIDLVLMDIMMPEMDGYEAMEHIRGQPQFKKLPIIALTAKAMRGDRARCIEAGASDYLAKPVDTERLLSILRVWLYK